ncbi:DNA-directed RNA polymerase subunit N [Nitrobacter sp.]|uniref:DNA-directed RNA polymerase subunit N n=1 Tax=Nitrobacter sp. TaxID=29420 RepID=UPI0039B40486
MKIMKVVAAVALALPLLSSATVAQERAGDAALGALSGAVVLGPVGALAGAVVGYAAGPSIAHSWGLRRSSKKQNPRSARRSQRRLMSANDTRHAPPAPMARPKAAPAAEVAVTPRAAETAMPPVQTLD